MAAPFTGSFMATARELPRQAGAVTLYGAEQVNDYLGALGERLADPAAMLTAHIGFFEAAERSRFDALAGYNVPHGRGDTPFVWTGATKDSLTDSGAPGAIREVQGYRLLFGTDVWYAKFLRRVDGPSGKPRGRKRVGPNLVLHLGAKDRQAARMAVKRWILEGVL